MGLNLLLLYIFLKFYFLLILFLVFYARFKSW